MGNCRGKLSKGFIRNCSYTPKKGLKDTIFLANTEDIDKAVSQLTVSGAKINSIALKTGAKIFEAQGAGIYPQGATELVKGEIGNGWKHTVTMRIIYYGEEQREELQKLVKDGRVTAILPKRDMGVAGELAYEVLGYESGMAVQSVAWSSNENSGTVEVVFATEEGEEESTDRKIFMSTDLDTTIKWLATNLPA